MGRNGKQDGFLLDFRMQVPLHAVFSVDACEIKVSSGVIMEKGGMDFQQLYCAWANCRPLPSIKYICIGAGMGGQVLLTIDTFHLTCSRMCGLGVE